MCTPVNHVGPGKRFSLKIRLLLVIVSISLRVRLFLTAYLKVAHSSLTH